MIYSIIISHGNCLDGSVATMLLEAILPGTIKVFKGNHFNNQELISNIKDFVDNETTSIEGVIYDVYLADYGFSNLEDMKSFLSIFDGKELNIKFLDHHVTFINALKTNAMVALLKPYNVVDLNNINRSGAGIAFELFKGRFIEGSVVHSKLLPLETLVLAVEDRDLWKFVHSYTKEICSVLFIDLGIIESHINHVLFPDSKPPEELSSIISKGKLLLQSKDNSVSKSVNNLTVNIYTVSGVNVGVFTTSTEYPSELCAEVLNRYTELDVVCLYKADLIKNTVSYSFRTRKDANVDVGLKLCQVNGGGGHMSACGCTTTLDNFLFKEISSSYS